MSTTVILDNINHHDLRVITKHSVALGDNINNALIFPTEFTEAQRHYPILFSRNPDGSFKTIALLGLDNDENLFLDLNGWNANYIPAISQHGPFFIGQPDKTDGTVTEADLKVLINLDSPRISKTEGERIFLEHGGNSPYLEKMLNVLRTLHFGKAMNDAMIDAFIEHNLIAPLNIEIKLTDGTVYNLPDFFTLSTDAIRDLKANELQALHNQGFLELAFYVVSSIGNFNNIIALKNAKRAKEA